MSNQLRIAKIQSKGDHNNAKSCSDDECVQKLAALLEIGDLRNLAAIASLMGRLAVPVE